MKRIVNIVPNNKQVGNDLGVSIYYNDDTNEIRNFQQMESVCIRDSFNIVNSWINKISISHTGNLKRHEAFQFEDCVFPNGFDLDFKKVNANVFFKNCIFMGKVNLFGDFAGIVSFEQSTFINANVSFQESWISHFNFKLVTLNKSVVDFQETEINGQNTIFNNLHLNQSILSFKGSVFPSNGLLLDFLAVESDDESKIIFRMVDFAFKELRLFHANIGYIEFIDCTFDCNRFDFDCECRTLIFQNCRNFKIINLTNIKSLKNFNICDMTNTGRVLFNENISCFTNAINTTEQIYWVRANEYKTPTHEEYKRQLFTMLDFFGTSQLEQKATVQQEIDILIKKEKILGSQENMRIFLSYSWNDKPLADSIDKKFSKSGITLIRDQRDVKYRKSIKEFMKTIRLADFVVLIISDSYLKSMNCMYEIAELTKDYNYRDRILPVIKNDVHIFTSEGQVEYIQYWQDEYKKKEKSAKKLEELNRMEIVKDLIRIERIMRDLPVFMKNISDMNLIKCGNSINNTDFVKMKHIIDENI